MNLRTGFCFCCLLLAATCAAGPRPKAEPGSQAEADASAETLARGRSLFTFHCGCHDPAGRKSLAGKSPEFVEKTLHQRKVNTISGFKKVKVGRLSDGEMEAIAQYVGTLKPLPKSGQPTPESPEAYSAEPVLHMTMP